MTVRGRRRSWNIISLTIRKRTDEYRAGLGYIIKRKVTEAGMKDHKAEG